MPNDYDKSAGRSIEKKNITMSMRNLSIPDAT